MIINPLPPTTPSKISAALLRKSHENGPCSEGKNVIFETQKRSRGHNRVERLRGSYLLRGFMQGAEQLLEESLRFTILVPKKT